MRPQGLYIYGVSFLFCFRKITQEVSFGFLRLFIYFSLFIYHPKNVSKFYFNLHMLQFFPYGNFWHFFFTTGRYTKGAEITDSINYTVIVSFG